jgi:GT2 family glycosyltransferase
VTAGVTASIVIAAYNAAHTLGAQLDALAPQIAAGVEVLVCDNGSTDATGDVVGARARTGLPVRIVDASARPGPAAARNIGAGEARGKLLLFCDADDVVDTGWVAAMTRALAAADLVAGRLDGRSLNTGNRVSVDWEVSAEIRMPFWTRYPAGASSNLGVRAAVFRAVGGFDERLRTGEDVDLCWRVQLAGFAFARAADALVFSRQRDGRRAVFRQAYSYGAGSRALRRKYSAFIAHDARHPAASAPATPGDAATPAAAPRPLAVRARRALTRSGQANLAWRAGEALGIRFGRIDPAVTPLPRP